MKTENQLFYESLPDHDIPGLAHRDLIYLFRRWKTFPKTEAEQDHYYQEVSDVLYLIRRSIRIGRDCKHPMASTRKMIEMLMQNEIESASELRFDTAADLRILRERKQPWQDRLKDWPDSKTHRDTANAFLEKCNDDEIKEIAEVTSKTALLYLKKWFEDRRNKQKAELTKNSTPTQTPTKPYAKKKSQK